MVMTTPTSTLTTTQSLPVDDYLKKFNQSSINLQFDVVKSDDDKVLPDIILWCYIGLIVVCGLVINLTVLIGLLKTKCNGN